MSKEAVILYINCSLGGVSSVLLDRVDFLQARGWRVHCVFERDYGGGATVIDRGAALHIFGSEFQRQLVNLVASRHVQLMFLLWHFQLARHFDIPTVVEVHGESPQALTQLADVPGRVPVVVPSDWTARLIRGHLAGGNPVHVVPNRVRAAETDAPPHAQDRRPARRLIWVGRIMDEHKNWRDALSVMACARRLSAAEGHDCSLEIVASLVHDPSVLDYVISYANSLGVGDVNVFHNLAPDRYAAYIRESASDRSVLLSTSKSETFGLAAAGAVAEGTPLVMSRGGAETEVFAAAAENGFCRFFERGEVVEAARHVLAYWNDAPAAGSAAHTRVVQSFRDGWAEGKNVLAKALDAATAPAG